MPPALHRPRVNLRETHPSPRDLGFLVALVTRPRKLAAHEGGNQPESLLAPQLSEEACWINAGNAEQHVREPVGHLRADRREDCALPLRFERLLPRRVVEGGPLHGDARRRAAFEPRAHHHVRHVQHRGAAVTAVRKEKAAGGRRAAVACLCCERDGERDPSEGSKDLLAPSERRERGVHWMHGVAEPFGNGKAGAVAPRVGHGESAGG